MVANIQVWSLILMQTLAPRDEDIVKLGWETALRTATTNYLPTAGGKLGLFVNKVSSLSLVKSSVDSMTTCLNLAGSYAR